jgi:6-phosphogluconate dehydrogenase (decarboxylating)
MVPAAFAGSTAEQLAALMESDDVIIDGGNSYYRDDIARSAALAKRASTTWTWAPAAACSGWNAGSA